MHYGSKEKLREVGIPFTRRSAVQLTRADYKNYDYLLAMDGNNLRNIKRIIPDDPDGKIHLLLEYAGELRSIADPWYTGNFDETYDDVRKGCDAFYEYLCAKGEL